MAGTRIPDRVNATYITVSFETSIRATSVGGAYKVGRIGAAIAPRLIGVIATLFHLTWLDRDGAAPIS